MGHAIRPVRLNHINMVLEDFEGGIAHFQALYGADFLADYPQKEWHAGLFDIGGTIFEPFVPPAWLLNSRYGPHYLGIEYQADMAAVRAAIADHGIRIVRDIGLAVHTHPADTLGVAFEFYDGAFHDREWPLIGGRMKPASHWSEDHPLGLAGLRAVTLVVADAAAALAFLQSFLSAGRGAEEDRPAIGARATSVAVADMMLLLLEPTGPGTIADHLCRHGPGIRSTVFSVQDTDRARGWFEGRGIALAEGDGPDAFAVPAAANCGVIFEFAA